MDRWDKEVFGATNYQNDWDGQGLSPGLYFYILDLNKDNKIYKGTLTYSDGGFRVQRSSTYFSNRAWKKRPATSSSNLS